MVFKYFKGEKSKSWWSSIYFLAYLYVSRMKLKQKKKRADARVGGEINEEEENGKE